MSSLSIVSPERRIELNPFDVDAWNLLLRESQARPIDQVRSFYEKLVAQFSNAGRYWKAYIDHEVVLEISAENLWVNVYYYFTELNLKHEDGLLLATAQYMALLLPWEKMAQAYEFALDKIGLDMHSYSIYSDYLSFLKSAPTVGQYAENQRISAVRKVYQRGVVTPMVNIEQLWAEYCAYEKSVNATLAEKLIAERNKEYQVAKRISKSLEQITRGLNRQAVSVPPRGTAAEMKQLDMWRKYIQWEKSNPLGTEEYAYFAKRVDTAPDLYCLIMCLVIYAYEQALLCLGYYPDMWYEAALFQQHAAAILAEKGDVKLAATMNTDIIQLFERAVGGLLKESQLLFFAYADYEEERMKFDNVRKIYDRLLAIETADPTLAYIQLMKFVRRTEGVQYARAIFKRARQDSRCKFHIFVASALMEYYCSKDTDIAIRVFDMGLKKYGDEPEYALAYVDFLSHLNEDNNTRVVFERILTSESMTPEKSIEIWDRYLEFESHVGDLSSILKVDQRRREALKEQYGEMQTLLLIDRYKFLDLVPCTNDQLRLMGYSKKLGQGSSLIGRASVSGTVSLLPNGAQTNGQNVMRQTAAGSGPSVVMGGGVSLEISGYPRPDTDQMIPFKPKLNTNTSYHPVPGGIFPPPTAAAQLMQMLPPPWCFNGPFVSVDLLMESLTKFNQTGPPSVDPKVKLENGTMFGIHRILASNEYQQQQTAVAQRKRRAVGGGDSDSDEEAAPRASGIVRDIYRRRMNQKVHD
ncbi:unnamed protein product [Acanthocheilonema viteae]|uniref:Suppressor of forked domain-containing protein n=1 Tax=Acanthocheilonema viteae TaxID=6277 RepID=A0A498S4M3_ACAVI|nr:unnamed protein product [Acanthocheilonema viteae]